jgi:hypothetical protein
MHGKILLSVKTEQKVGMKKNDETKQNVNKKRGS